ncbi:MAG: type II secretion system protein [Planctomycetes bacterium]|nr:type II secretion system protein [Planctomycetota bacterium]
MNTDGHGCGGLAPHKCGTACGLARRSPDTLCRDEGGFTLIEVMAAVAILSVSVVIIFHALAVCIDARIMTENYNRATALAIEEIQYLDKPSGDETINNIKFAWTLDKEAPPTGESGQEYPALQELSLIMEWSNPDGRRKGQVTLKTYILEE